MHLVSSEGASKPIKPADLGSGVTDPDLLNARREASNLSRRETAAAERDHNVGAVAVGHEAPPLPRSIPSDPYADGVPLDHQSYGTLGEDFREGS